MPTERAKKRAQQDKKAGKSPSTQAGEYVREEMHKLKHGGGRAQSRKQAIAIGLSEARREGVDMPGPGKRGRKKAAAKKRSVKKSPSKRAGAKKTASKKSASKRSSAKRTSRKRASR